MKSPYIFAILIGVGAAVAAQVPVSQEPHHRVVIETPAFRMLGVNVPPGATTEQHVHTHDIVTVSMNGEAETRAQAPGEAWGDVRPRRAVGHASVVEYAGKPGTHRIENVGKAPYQLLAVENLRTSGWSTAPPLKDAIATLTAESRAFRVYDLVFGEKQFQTSHVHAVPALAVMVRGKLMSQGPELPEDARPAMPSGLKQLDQPGQWVYVPAGEAHFVVRLGTDTARLVEIELR